MNRTLNCSGQLFRGPAPTSLSYPLRSRQSADDLSVEANRTAPWSWGWSSSTGQLRPHRPPTTTAIHRTTRRSRLLRDVWTRINELGLLSCLLPRKCRLKLICSLRNEIFECSSERNFIFNHMPVWISEFRTSISNYIPQFFIHFHIIPKKISIISTTDKAGTRISKYIP